MNEPILALTPQSASDLVTAHRNYGLELSDVSVSFEKGITRAQNNLRWVIAEGREPIDLALQDLRTAIHNYRLVRIHS